MAKIYLVPKGEASKKKTRKYKPIGFYSKKLLIVSSLINFGLIVYLLTT